MFIRARFRRQLVKLIDLCSQKADTKTSNDDKQLIELKLASHIHALALRCLPNPEKNEVVLKSFVVYAIKAYKPNESSILSIFRQALTDGIKAKEVYARAV